MSCGRPRRSCRRWRSATCAWCAAVLSLLRVTCEPPAGCWRGSARAGACPPSSSGTPPPPWRPTGAGVAIVCSGTDGRPALEDVYVAGRLVAALGGVPSDAARVAERVASGYGKPLQPLALSEDATQLRATGQGRDIAWCARESVLEVVPEVWSTQDGASVVGLADSHRDTPMKIAKNFA